MNNLYKFKAFLKRTIWGGEDICRFKGIQSDFTDIGESWELSAVPGGESTVVNGPDAGATLTDIVKRYKGALVGESVYKRFGDEFPLLIKFIDARDNLSLQVHPDDELAMKRHNSLGKTEMWYILKTAPGATIRTGLTKAIDKDEYTRRVAEKNLMDVVGLYESAPGDVFFLPAGRLHAIGAGNFLVEIQESSNITYRVDDYDRRDAQGNTRELHTEEAKDAIDYKFYPDCKSAAVRVDDVTEKLASCEFFDVNVMKIDGEATVVNNDDSFLVLICIEGSGILTAGEESLDIKQGETVLVPATVNEVLAKGKLSLVTSTVPGKK